MGQLTIAQAVQHIKDNEYVMPAFQRQYVWTITQIEKLWDSILLGYPISNFLFWHIDQTNVSEDTHFCYFLHDATFRDKKSAINKNYQLAPIKFEKTNTAVLDGQQRLTSLYLSLFGTTEKMRKYGRKNSNSTLCKLFIELNPNNIETEEDNDNGKEYDIRLTDKNSSPSQFEVRKLMNPELEDEIKRKEFFNNIISRIPPDGRDYALKTLEKLYSKIFIEKIINYTELTGMQQEDALEVFVRFNSGGSALKKSDITMSILETYWPDSKTAFYEVLKGSYTDFGTDFIIRTALMLYSDVLKSNISISTAQTLQADWQNLAKTFKNLEDLLKEINIDISRFSSSWNVLLPIIYAIHFNPNYKDNIDGIKIYLFRAIFFTYFRSGTTGKLNALKKYLNDFNFEFQADTLDSHIKPLALKDHTAGELLNTQKKDKLAYDILYYINLDWIAPNYKFELDHLHPYSGFDAYHPEIDRDTWTKWRLMRDDLPNLSPLVGWVNAAKNDDPLILFYNQMNPEQQPVYRKQSLIPDDISLEFQNFAEFYEKRGELLRKKIDNLLRYGKTEIDEKENETKTEIDTTIE